MREGVVGHVCKRPERYSGELYLSRVSVNTRVERGSSTDLVPPATTANKRTIFLHEHALIRCIIQRYIDCIVLEGSIYNQE